MRASAFRRQDQRLVVATPATQGGAVGGARWAAGLVLVVVLACQPTASATPSEGSPLPAPTTQAPATPTPTPTGTSSPDTSAAPTPGAATIWEDVTDAALGETAEWTNKVEVADLDGDTRPDLLFANGGLYEVAGPPEPARAFRNAGAGRFEEITETVFGAERFLSRAIKVGDLDADGDGDIVVSGTFGTPTRVFVADGPAFTEAEDGVPGTPMSVGDVELGDVDGDADLDLVLADWGDGSPMSTRAAGCGSGGTTAQAGSTTRPRRRCRTSS